MDIDPGDLNHETNVYEVTTSNVLSQGFLFCLGKPNEVDGNIVYSMYSVNPDKSINKRIGTYTVPSDKAHLGDLSMKGFDALDAFTTIGEPTLIEKERKGKSKPLSAEKPKPDKSGKPDKAKEDKSEKPEEEKTDKPEEDKTDKPEEDKTDKPEEDKTDKPEEDKTDKPEEDKTDKPEEDKTDKPEEDNADKTEE
jgi:hypothetical protein